MKNTTTGLKMCVSLSDIDKINWNHTPTFLRRSPTMLSAEIRADGVSGVPPAVGPNTGTGDKYHNVSIYYIIIVI